MTKAKYDKLSYLDKQDVDWILNEIIESKVYPLHMKIEAKEAQESFSKPKGE